MNEKIHYPDLSGLDPKPKPKKFPTVVFILIMLIGFMFVAGAALWVESRYNTCVVELYECEQKSDLMPEKKSEGGDWYEKYLNGS